MDVRMVAQFGRDQKDPAAAASGDETRGDFRRDRDGEARAAVMINIGQLEFETMKKRILVIETVLVDHPAGNDDMRLPRLWKQRGDLPGGERLRGRRDSPIMVLPPRGRRTASRRGKNGWRTGAAGG